jgi:hypothetical protein
VDVSVSIALVKRAFWGVRIDLAYLPEILYHGIALSVAAVVCVLLPVVNIDVCYSTNEQLELTLIEDVDQVSRDELVEALHKGVELLIHTFLDAPFRDQSVVLVSKVEQSTS